MVVTGVAKSMHVETFQQIESGRYGVAEVAA